MPKSGLIIAAPPPVQPFDRLHGLIAAILKKSHYGHQPRNPLDFAPVRLLDKAANQSRSLVALQAMSLEKDDVNHLGQRKLALGKLQRHRDRIVHLSLGQQ